MKKPNRTKEINLIACIFFGLSTFISCKSPSDESQKSNAINAPVGVILPPSDEAPGLEIAIRTVPNADDKIVAESMSAAFHKARAKCAKVLKTDSQNVFNLSGVTVFEGKISISDTKTTGNPIVDCITDALKNQPLPGFEDQTHVLEIQFAVRDIIK